MTIKIYFRRQPTKIETEPIYLRFEHLDIRFHYKTEFKIKKGGNLKNIPIHTKHSLEKCIVSIKENFNSRIDFKPTKIWFERCIKEYLNSSKRNGYLLNDIMEEFINKKKLIPLKPNTIKDLNQSASIIKSFRNDIELADCNSPLFEKFKSWLQFDNEFATSNANRKIGFLRNVLKDAKKLYPSEVPDDFRDLEGITDTKLKKNIKANLYKVTFTDAELDSINKLELTNDYLINARKWLNIGVHTALRGADLLSLELEDFDFDNEHIKWQQGKVGTFAFIPIVPPLLEQTKDYPRKISKQKLNDYLKELCRLAGMNQIITAEKSVMKKGIGMRTVVIEAPKYTFCSSHMFRRTFVTKYYGKVADADIMRVTGHKSEKEFKNYIQETESNNDIWFKLYENGL